MVVVQDDGGTDNGGADGSAPQTFNFTINSVNDQPGFAIGTGILRVESGAGPQSFSGFVQDVSPGPADEAHQAMDWIFTLPDNLLKSPPVITEEGAIMIDPAPGASGQATISLRLRDDGGISNGGIDTSEAKNFTVQFVEEEPLELEIEIVGGNVKITWPYREGTLLQQASTVLGPWFDLPGPYTELNGRSSVELSASSISQYFRSR